MLGAIPASGFTREKTNVLAVAGRGVAAEAAEVVAGVWLSHAAALAVTALSAISINRSRKGIGVAARCFALSL